jgi:hypothetical protein
MNLSNSARGILALCCSRQCIVCARKGAESQNLPAKRRLPHCVPTSSWIPHPIFFTAIRSMPGSDGATGGLKEKSYRPMSPSGCMATRALRYPIAAAVRSFSIFSLLYKEAYSSEREVRSRGSRSSSDRWISSHDRCVMISESMQAIGFNLVGTFMSRLGRGWITRSTLMIFKWPGERTKRTDSGFLRPFTSDTGFE